ncbi:carboxypeptidase-like regulatory domain-containing protein [Winogradskyella sp. SYSU M77433]|uniref:carboxypeptidase-like regulatory domain-containing protein n=1 Tax=Winogradskyella sp. SYSU M77433 TaxID=3042722 RepID=UPI0024807D74|nr:carboxypeptidase-like regulatory domain-containing protein [Winogradskyella sp. SYSU M77433]MDH7913097.1 carboxypeptidase-like regulatory domain-containing protein [Winogradskyella sp. SYSU M77433]
MENQISLSINRPCNEDFSSFSPTQKGGFCDACQKEVIDFTKMNTDDIITFFKNNQTQNTCGRLKIEHLETPLKVKPKRKRLGLFTGICLSILAFFSVSTAKAQELKKSKDKIKQGTIVDTLKNKNNIVVKGTITTESDGLPLPGASVVLQGTSQGIQTDFDGNFEFPNKLKKGDVLIVSYIGMESQKIVIENKKSASLIELKINMDYDSCVIVGEVAVKEIFKSKKN